jgi:hypothetical protein
MVSFEGNVAEGAGGGVFVECHTQGDCSHRVALPGPNGNLSLALSFSVNHAGSFGADMATGPRELELQSVHRQYVPGQTVLNLTVALVDMLGQQMQSETHSALPYLVSVNVCPADEIDCGSTAGLQPVGYLQVAAGRKTASTVDLGSVLRYCVVGEPQVVVELRVFGQGVAVDESLLSLGQRVLVDCAPCQVSVNPLSRTQWYGFSRLLVQPCGWGVAFCARSRGAGLGIGVFWGHTVVVSRARERGHG